MSALNRGGVWLGVVLIPVSLLLGYIGYRDLAEASMSRPDAAFGAIQLFFMETQTDLDQPPLALNIARFSAPLSLAIATFAAIVALAGERIRRLLLRQFGRDHVVIAGLSETGRELARSLRSQGRRVVVLDSDASHPAAAEVQALGALVIVGDARQPEQLMRCRVDTARHVVVNTGHDSINVEVCEVLTAVAGHATTVHAAIDDEALWSVLGRVQLEESDSAATFDFFHPDDRKAASFIDAVDQGSGADVSEVYLLGRGALARRVLVRWCQRRLAEGEPFAIHVDAATHRALVGPSLAALPWIRDVVTEVDVVPTSCRIGLVCSDVSDGASLSAALSIASERQVDRVFLCSTLPSGRAVLDLKGVSEKVCVVPAGSTFREPQAFFALSWVEIMAAARHDFYCASERSRGVTAADNPSLVAWGELPESLKDSNRRFAAAVGAVLGDLGAGLVPLGPRTASKTPPVESELMESLARREHDRWMADLLLDGWRYEPGAKDPVRKTHPLLVDWAELDEIERDKDRDSIRAIPQMLARVGWALDVPARAPAS
jgi:voltage-gated potassium channel Kch